MKISTARRSPAREEESALNVPISTATHKRHVLHSQISAPAEIGGINAEVLFRSSGNSHSDTSVSFSSILPLVPGLDASG